MATRCYITRSDARGLSGSEVRVSRSASAPWPILAVLLLNLLALGAAHAQAVLSLQAATGLKGAPTSLTLNIANAPVSGGFNAHIVLPAGISVLGVSPGTLLTTAGGFTVSYGVNGQNLKILAYSGTTTFSASGQLAVLNLQVAGNASTGYFPVDFALTNANLLVNSRHALSNNDGSVSLPHTTAGQNFLVYSSTSDFDADTLPDRWEVEKGLSPLVSVGPDGGSGDPDGDGVVNRDEYKTGTKPKDNLSRPEGAGGISYVLFRDRFDDAQYEDRWYLGATSPGALYTFFESGTLLDATLQQPVSACHGVFLQSIATVDTADTVFRTLIKPEGLGKTSVGLMQNTDLNNRLELQFNNSGTPTLRLRSWASGVETVTPAAIAKTFANTDVEIRLVKKAGNYWVFVNKILQFQIINTALGAVGLRPFLAAESCNTDGGYVFSHFDLIELLKDTDADGLADLYEDVNLDGQLSARESNRLVPDTDGDTQLDGFDNCTLVANTNQRDSNGDYYGNVCDADLNNSGLTNTADFAIQRSVLNQSVGNLLAAAADLNHSGTVTAADFAILRSVLNQSASASPTAAAADLNGSGTVTTADFALLRSVLNQSAGNPVAADADLNGSGTVTTADVAILRSQLNQPPGPSGLK